jgi:nucleolar protein 14
MVNTMNFGGDAQQDLDKKKSRKEIFEEIIEKSKAYKDANKVLKTINTELIKELDDDYLDIIGKLDFTRRKNGAPAESQDPKIKTADEKGKEFDSVQYSLKMNLIKAQPVAQTLTEHDKAA